MYKASLHIISLKHACELVKLVALLLLRLRKVKEAHSRSQS